MWFSMQALRGESSPPIPITTHLSTLLELALALLQLLFFLHLKAEAPGPLPILDWVKRLLFNIPLPPVKSVFPMEKVQLHITTINPAFLSLPSLCSFHKSSNLSGSAGSLGTVLSGTRVLACWIRYRLLSKVTHVLTWSSAELNRRLGRWLSGEEH